MIVKLYAQIGIEPQKIKMLQHAFECVETVVHVGTFSAHFACYIPRGSMHYIV